MAGGVNIQHLCSMAAPNLSLSLLHHQPLAAYLSNTGNSPGTNTITGIGSIALPCAQRLLDGATKTDGLARPNLPNPRPSWTAKGTQARSSNWKNSGKEHTQR